MPIHGGPEQVITRRPGVARTLTLALTIRSMLLLIGLGLLLAGLQTMLDFRQRQGELANTIDSILTSSRAAASEAVFLLDNDLAEQLVEGLAHFDFFREISIIDDHGTPMASFTRYDGPDAYLYGSPHLLLSLFTDHLTERRIALDARAPVEGVRVNSNTGELRFVVDNHTALASVLERTFRAFAITFAGYAVFGAALGMVVHYSLAAPLVRLSTRFQEIDVQAIAGHRLAHEPGHNRDEFGLIVDAANELLVRISLDQEQLSERSKRFQLILDTAPAMIFSLDQKLRFVFANKATAKFYNCSIFDFKGCAAREVIEHCDPDFMKLLERFSAMREQRSISTTRVFDSARSGFDVELTLVKFSGPDGHSILVHASDISERVQAEARVEALAYYDQLTSLPNRNCVYDRLSATDSSATAETYCVAAIADIDHFQRINDTMGHAVGDQLMVQLARRFESTFSHVNHLARLGDDEFLFVEKVAADSAESAMEQALQLGEALRLCVNDAIEIGANDYLLTVSVGLVVYRSVGTSVHEVLQHADTAMHEAKRRGRNRVSLFKDEMAANAAERLAMERDLLRAMAHNDFYFVLQPIVDSNDQSLRSAEALLRCRSAEGVKNPAQFIPFLEESGLIVDVGYRTLRAVCEYLKDLDQRCVLPSDFTIAVNISSRQLLHPSFAQTVERIVEETGVTHSRLQFEVTESVALEYLDEAIRVMNGIREMGIDFSLDDFGTGYSSLSYLKDLPVDRIKLDRSFVKDIAKIEQNANLVRSVIQLADNLGLALVAEGVETREEVDWLRRNSVDVYFQGYYFSRPLDLQSFERSYFPQRAVQSES